VNNFLDVGSVGGDRCYEWVVVKDQVFDCTYWYWSDAVDFAGFACFAVPADQGGVVDSDDDFGVVATWWFELVGVWPAFG